MKTKEHSEEVKVMEYHNLGKRCKIVSKRVDIPLKG